MGGVRNIHLARAVGARVALAVLPNLAHGAEEKGFLGTSFDIIDLVYEVYDLCSRLPQRLHFLYDDARETAVDVATSTVYASPESLAWIHEELGRVYSGCPGVGGSIPSGTVGCEDYLKWARVPYPNSSPSVEDFLVQVEQLSPSLGDSFRALYGPYRGPDKV